MTRRDLTRFGAAGFAMLLLATAPRRARACGGFFCNQIPVDQSGEQIVFSIDEQHVTAYIQISFKGEAKDFAWVVPVATKPVISVGTQSLFTQLQSRTQPSFNIEWSFDKNNQCFFGYAEDSAAGSVPKAAPGGGVQVIDESEVGPYHTVTLESSDPDALIKWLNENGYDQPDSAAPLITHYVSQGMFFVALKLKQNATVGEIQPLVLDMDNDPEACVPLILTRVAAVANMPVLVYVLGQHRAVPRNWFNVEVNERKINWMSYGSNYAQLVTQAIDEAAGHGFVTEYAGDSKILKGALYTAGRYNLEALRGITDPAQLLQTLLQMGYPRDQSMQALLRQFIPMPDSLKGKIDERMFYNNIQAYRAELAGFKVDIDGFIAALDERVVKPLKTAQAMIDAKPYLTRLYSTVSPDEMTRDPLFHMNPDLPTVSNVHTAKGTAECDTNGMLKNVVLTLPGGDVIRLGGMWRSYSPATDWTFAAQEPAAKVIELVGPSGRATRYDRVQAKAADQYLDLEPPEAVRARAIPGEQDLNTGWCNVAPRPAGSAGGVAVLLLAAGLGLYRRRRRR